MTKLILASTSPRRKEILKNAGLSFTIEKSDYEEKLDSPDFSQEKIEEIAKKKGEAIALNFPNDIVVSADTVVVFDNKIFTKPKNKKHAFDMLKTLSNKTHFVQTSICIIYKSKKIVKSTKTYVTFNDLTDEMITNYINKYNPLDKAGAYGIQELPDEFISNIDGDLENVIGLSSNVLKGMLRNINIHDLTC